MEEEPPNFGVELKDSFKPVNAWVRHGVEWMADIEAFFRERATIEREYSAKLAALAKKYFEKKSRKTSILSVGDTPTLTPGSLESASMTTWTSLLTTTELLATEHDNLGVALNFQCGETMKNMSIRYEELRVRHEKLEKKITNERDVQNAELKKAKVNYDSECKELEDKRVKLEKSYDSSKGKAESSYQKQMAEMHNVKNTYIIALNVTNAQKEKYYHSDVPDIVSSMQDLNETRVQTMNALWTLSCSLGVAAYTKTIELTNALSAEISRNNPQLDSLMFIKHNAPPNGLPWAEPPDDFFVASPIWHDTGEIVVDDAAKVWLQNKISKSKGGLDGYRQDVEKWRRDVDVLRTKREGLRGKGADAVGGRRSAEEIEVLKALLQTQEGLFEVDGKRITLEVEVETVRQACGDIDRGAQAHKFKPTSFKIPTSCDVCGDKIWGLSAKGVTCTDCGYNCHAKCEMKVPLNCPGPLDKAAKKALKETRQAGAHTPHTHTHTHAQPQPVADGIIELPASNGSSTTLDRSNTTASTTSSVGLARSGTATSSILSKATSSASKVVKAPPARRVLAPPPTKYVTELPADTDTDDEPLGKMKYPFTATGDGEISVGEGKEVKIIEPDNDGSGWIRVRNGLQEGVVPTSYVEILSASSSSRPSHALSQSYSQSRDDRPSSSYSSSTASLASTNKPKKQGPVVAPRKGAKVVPKKQNYAEALYDYKARTADEFDMVVGEKFVLINPDTGDGWAEVQRGGETKAVPSNYITPV